MNISARNQFRGSVASIQTGAVNAEVIVNLPGGCQLAAIVTNSSVQALGLAAGKEVVALVKASSALLMTAQIAIVTISISLWCLQRSMRGSGRVSK